MFSPRYNVSLFHYRSTGNRSSSVLLGLQLPLEERAAFEDECGKLGSDFVFSEISE